MKEIKDKTNYMIMVERAHGKPLEELLRHLYVDKGRTIVEIGEELGISTGSAFNWLKKANVTTRKMKWL